MEGIKKECVTLSTKTKVNGEMITFVSLNEIEVARRELQLSGIPEEKFSDAEIILAVRQQRELNANSIVSIVVDWLVESNFILSGSQAIRYLLDSTRIAEGCHHKIVGDSDFDRNGTYYMIAATKEQKLERLYKVYTHGTIAELHVDK